METIQEDIDISQVPKEYGGQSERALGDSDDERKVTSPLLAFVGFPLSQHFGPLCGKSSNCTALPRNYLQ